jgi:hypothetical protein
MAVELPTAFMYAGAISAIPCVREDQCLTGRTVRTFLSGMDEDVGSSIEAFLLEPEVPAN